MRRRIPLSIAVAAGIGLASQSDAAFTITTSIAPNFLNADGTGPGTVNNVNPTLKAAGWHGYVVTITASGGDIIGTVMLTVDILGTFGGLNNVGVIGPVHQSYQWQDADVTHPAGIYPTPFGWAATSRNNPTAASTDNGRDSLFLNSGYYKAAKVSPGESPNPPGASPLDSLDEPGVKDEGIGTRMYFTGATDTSIATPNLTLNFAYLIVQYGLTFTLVNGYILNQNNFATPFSIVVNPLPEPASLSVLFVGGLALLSRRRRTA